MADGLARNSSPPIEVTSVVTNVDPDWASFDTDLVLSTIEPGAAGDRFVRIQPFLTDADVDRIQQAAGRLRRGRRLARLREELARYFHPDAFVHPLPDDGEEAIPQVAARARAGAPRWRIDHPWFKFGLFPLLLALPAFRLHQHIAYGGTFGEYYSFGLQAWLLALLIWWASWSIGMTLFGAVLRVLVELGALSAQLVRPRNAASTRSLLQGAARVLYFIGAPAWLAWRLVAG